MSHMPLELRKALRKARKATKETLPATSAEWIALHGGSAKQCDIARRRIELRINVKADKLATAADKHRVMDHWVNREPQGIIKRGDFSRSKFTGDAVVPRTRHGYISL